MKTYSFIVEVRHTRNYQIQALTEDHAVEQLREDFGIMPFDTLEEEIDNIEVEDVT